MKSILRLTIFLLLVLLFLPAAHAKDECKVKYSWNTGNVLEGNFKNHSKTIKLDKGQTKNIGKNRMNYVLNKKSNKVKFYLDNASDVTLGKDQRNPAAGNYITTVKLVKAKCEGSSLKTSSKKKKKGVKMKSGPCVSNAPNGLGGTVPLPYPCVP